MINILRELCRNKKGRIEGVSMAEMLQLIWLEKMTCRLLVKSNGRSGTLNIQDGELKNAKTVNKRDKEAAFEILTWDNVTIELDGGPSPIHQAIHVTTEEILQESRLCQGGNKEAAQVRVPDGGRAANVGEKEAGINVSKLLDSFDALKESLGGALLSTEILEGSDMQPIASWNTQPMASALFGRVILLANEALRNLDYSRPGKYYIFDLEDGKLILLVPIENYTWGMVVDGKQVQLGLLLNVALPKAIAVLKDAIANG
jgi:hypothetical protein